MRRNWGVWTQCKAGLWSTTGIVVTTIPHCHCRFSFSLIQREGVCVCVLAFCFGSEWHQDPAGMWQHIHECGSGSDLARGPWPQQVSSTTEELKSSSNCSWGHSFTRLHLEYSSTDKEAWGHWTKQGWTFQSQSTIGLRGP